MSRLYERMAVPCVRLERDEAPDGEGGVTVTWREGKAFAAAIARDTSSEARVAEAAGVANAYTVTGPERLSFGDVFRRVGDGQTFRVTSDGDDGAAPACATFSFYQSTAEEWGLPDA